MVLSIDTFSDNFSVALLNGEKLVASLSLLKPKPFSEVLMPEIDQMFVKTGLSKGCLSAVVVNKGPGSNTGLRVGLTTAKVISYTLDVPIYTYVSLDVMAYQYRHFCGKVVPVINIGKGQVVYKIFQDDKQIKDLTTTSTQEFLNLFIDKHNYLIVKKNIQFETGNSVEVNTPLSITGGVYAVLKGLKEDRFLVQPIYHS